MRSFVFALILSLTSIAAFAKTPLAPTFTATFETNYRAGECGTNIMNLVKIANQNGIDLSSANILQITNKGLFNFGMVGGFEARSYRFPPPTREKVGYADLKNWFHHVVLEHEGYIYDYDFGTEAEILPIAEYFERMLLPERKWSMGAQITPREERLAKYQIEIHSAADFLSQQSGKGETVSLGEVLNGFAASR